MPADPTIVRAFLILAETRGREWLVEELERVALAVIAGQPTVKSLALEGGSTTFESEMPAKELLATLQRTLEELDGDSTASGALLIPRIASFDLNS